MVLSFLSSSNGAKSKVAQSTFEFLKMLFYLSNNIFIKDNFTLKDCKYIIFE